MTLGLQKRDRGDRRPDVLIYIDLVQDIDILLPVICVLRDRTPWRLRVVVARWLSRASPRTAVMLRNAQIRFRYCARRTIIAGSAPALERSDLILTAAESSAATHTAAWALVKRSSAPSFTFQHGLENVGLSPSPWGEYEVFASSGVFCWLADDALPPTLPAATRAKLVSIARPKAPVPPATPTYDVAVFENLHADRYSQQDRADFLINLDALVAGRPDLSLYIRSHPAGGWLDAKGDILAAHSNVTFVPSAQSRAEPWHGGWNIARARRVITTPSTVALDAAQIGRPVALACAGGRAYNPLPVLLGSEDWLAFAAEAPDDRGAREFADRVTQGGDWADQMLWRLKCALKVAGRQPLSRMERECR